MSLNIIYKKNSIIINFNTFLGSYQLILEYNSLHIGICRTTKCLINFFRNLLHDSIYKKELCLCNILCINVLHQ